MSDPLDLNLTTPNPFAAAPGEVSGETIRDAIRSLTESHGTLLLAGAPPEQLAALKNTIAQMRKKMEEVLAERRRREQREADAAAKVGPGDEDDGYVRAKRAVKKWGGVGGSGATQ